MRGNLPGPFGLAGRGASAALRGWSVVPLRPAPRALHPLPAHYPMARAKPNCIARIYGPANAAHGKYSDRLPGPRTFLLACTSLVLLSGCGSRSYSSNHGTVTPTAGPVST